MAIPLSNPNPSPNPNRSHLLVGNYGVSNAGDEILREYFLERFPEIEWKVLSACPQEGEFPRIPAGARSFLSFGWFRTIRELRRSQGMVFGGGTLFTDAESVRACLLWFLHAFVARLFWKSVFLAFQGIGPFQTRIGEWCARWVVSRASFISVRDEESYFRVTRHPLHHADPSASSGSLGEKLPGRSGVTLSSSKCEQSRPLSLDATLDRLESTWDDPRGTGRVEAREWQKSIEVVQSFDPSLTLLSEKNHDNRTKKLLIYIPRFSTGGSAQDDTPKVTVLTNWAKQGGRIRILSLQPLNKRERMLSCSLAASCNGEVLFATSLRGISSDLADADLIITERFHGALVALSQGTPFVAVRQKAGDKLETLAKLCGCPVMDDSSMIFDLISAANWEEIASRFPAIREECLKLVKDGEDALRKALTEFSSSKS